MSPWVCSFSCSARLGSRRRLPRTTRQTAASLPAVTQQGRQELGSDSARIEAIAVLGEHGDVRDRCAHRQADEPAEKKIVFDLLYELTLRADRVKRLQQHAAQQLLR